MKRKLTALLLALLTASSALLSCASNPEEEKTNDAPTSSPSAEVQETEAETESPLAMDDLGEADFGGASYIIAGLSNRTTTAVTSTGTSSA